ncbi:hypothetical protein V6N11_070169 [Hibiscus sabdariffa]|uniref:Uncharacterized protein n=1 Tax=Hibiscus sabdariffa TaxID=183260 RepID=A0ABR2QE69_9ROSI
MERLDGFAVYGFRLTVKPETQIGNRVSSHWNITEAWRATQRMKVRGHVVVEELWKLQSVLELGFKDNSVDPLNMNGNQKVQLKKDSSSESVQSFQQKGGRDKDDVADATFNALEDENETGAGDEGFLGNMNSQKGELSRRNSSSNFVKEKGDGVGSFGLNLKGSKSQSWAEVVLKGGGSQNGDQRLGSKRVSSPNCEGEERHTRWAEDLSPLQANDFEFDTEYYSWYLENGKPFLVSVEVGNKWREDPRCSKHRQLTSEFGQSFEEPIDDPYDEPNFDRSRGWPSSCDSVEEQPSFGNVWNSVEEQPPMYGGGSSSQPAYTDDGGYIPQMDYTSITGSSYHPKQMHGTPPSMQVDDQWFNDEQTPDQPRRIVRPPKRSKQNKATSRWPCGPHGSISCKQTVQAQPGHVQVVLLPQLNPAIGFARRERVDPRPGHLEEVALWPEEVNKESFSHPDPEADKRVGHKEITSVSWANILD